MLWLSALGSVSAQTATFDLKGVSIELQEVTADTAVFFRSLRLNRALNQWNVEVTVSNRADRALSGPLVLLVESFRGTSGPLLVDGTLGGATPRAFYDLSSLTPSGELGAHQSTASRTLSLGFTTGSPVLVTRVFAGTLPPPVPIGVTRSLNDVGQPLAGTTLTVTGPAAGSSAVQTTDRPTGVASFGETAGAHGLKFTQEGSLSVWRQQTLFTGSVAVVPNPRLTPRSSRVIEVTPLGGSVVTNDTGTVRIGVNAGAFGGSASLRLTGLTGQTLPAFLPQGWSPLQAFHLETSSAPTQPLPASLKPFGSVGTTEVAALARWNETTLLWEVVQVVGGRGAEPLDVLLPTAGSFVLVVGDSGELAPPVPIVGQPLVSSQAPVEPIAGLTATGVVDPSSSPASQVPVRVTGQATVTLNHASAKLPSGTLLRGEVTETYLLKDGSFRITPSYEQFFVAYQRPGDEDLQTIQASFPMRPLLLFGAEELSTATVRIDVLPLTPFDGRVVDQRGGQLALPGGRVLIGAGQLSAATAFRLSPLSVSPITNSLPLTMSAVTGFELTFDASRLTGPLSPRFDGLAPNASFVLARVLSEVGLFGLEPVERFQTDAQGVVSSGEAISGDRLAGIRGSGQYVLIKVDRAQGLISGVARDGKGSLRSGMPVRAAGTPWVALTDNQGRFHLVAAVGTQQIEVTDPATGDTGASAVTVTDPLQVVGQDLASAPAGPRVVSTTPADAARQVPLVTSVIVQFSEPVNPLTLIGDAIQLIGPDNAVVSASVSLNLANRIATLSPGSDLNPGTVYRVVLAGTIADASGLRLEGKSQFTFTTAAASVRTASSQLVIYEPGATNVPVAILDDIPAYEPGQDPTAIVVHGTPGTADPEVPVILANESTGETATVLSKVDGSFSSVISGSEEDFVSATFVNLNKTRVYVPVSRQEFDNGFVGLYRTGGILEAQSDGGPVKVIIKPEVISNRTKLRMKPMSRAQLLQETDGAEPDAGGLAANPMRLEIEGDPITEPINISFAVNLLTAGFPRDADPGQAGLALTRVLDVNGIKTFEVVDQLIFHPGSFATNSIQPSPAPRLQDVINDENEELFYGAADLLIGFLPVTGIDVGQAVFQYIFVPLLIGNKAVTVKGKTLTSASAEETHAAGGAADAAVEAALDLTTSKPLQGSFIALKRVSVPVGQRGRLQPGMVHATSGADGRFLLVAPYANDAYILTATHPRFDDVLSEPVVGVFDLGLAGAVFKTFRFRQPLALQTAPTVNIAHTPLTPAPGDEVEVQITATHGPGAAPPSITVLLDSVKSLVQGVEVDASEAKIVAGPPVAIGPYTTRWTGKVSIAKAARVVIRAIVIGSNKQSHTPIRYPIDFDGRPQPDPDNPIPSPDPEDKKGPLVITTLPNERGFVNENGEISIFFNEPIDRSVLQQLSGIVLDGPSTFSPPVLELSPDQTTLQIRYLGLKPGADYSLSLSSLSLRDLLGNPFDQVPNTKPSDNFVLHFKTSPVKVTALPEITAGKGAVMHGVHLYVLQAGTENQLIAYDVSRPNTPVLLSHPRVVGVPRDLVVIPDFGYKTAPDDSVHNGEIVAVVGGDLDTKIDELGNVTVPGQNLVVFDMADPKNPRQLAAATISYRVASAVTKLRWEPPYLVYQEFGADLHQIGFIDLQEFIWGFSAPVVRRDTFPVNGRRGQDNNGDGDYVDEGEILPIPELRPPEFYGKKISYPLEDTRQKVLDFSVSAGVVGITLTGGVSPSGVALRPSYRTLAFNGQPLDRTLATYGFHVGSYPRRVFCQAGVPVEVGGRLETLVVALVGLAADFDGKNRLAVLDITLPESPKLINTIEIPEALLGGGLQAIQQREDGSLLVATSQNILTLEPRLLGVTNFPAGQLHPSVTGIVPQAGSGTPSYASSSFGVHGVAQGGRAQVLQTPPPMTFVQFPERPELVASAQFPLKNSEIQTLLGQLRPVRSLFPARVRKALDKPSDLLPPRPAAHFYVLMEAPGGSGHKVELGLEALTSSGRPLANLGVGFAPVRAASFLAQRDLKQLPRENCDAPMRSLTAYRMSDDSNSPYYNFYLSKAFAVVYESVTIAELEELRSAADREILFVSAFLRAFIDPSESVNSGVGAFAAQIDFDELTLQPPASATAFCLELPYIMGENTTPLAGAVTMAGSHGTVNAHSGEFRTEETDMALPSPMMPITIERAIGGQDHYNGPFGYGWDFNYNQRLTELNPEVFPLGLEMPLIDRGTRADSVLGSSKDILLHSGAGRLVRFRWVSDSMPPEYAQDPLVRQFNYAATVAAYYLPEPGSFDLLVKFKNGTFERLSSGGQRHRYAANGRLELVMDAYPKNRHELTYDRSGLLVRIDDRSVADDRFVEFGYYRMAGDRAFTAELDELTTDPYRQGKVRRLRDYVGRDVLFVYNDMGELIRREGVHVSGQNGGFGGRPLTHYHYENCKIKGVSITQQGLPLVGAEIAPGKRGAPVAQKLQGAGGTTVLDIPPSTTAANLGGLTTSSKRESGETTEHTFNKHGYPEKTRIFGGNGPAAEVSQTFNTDGLVLTARDPEGGVTRYTYDSSNPIFRSRANLLQTVDEPGPRGGDVLTRTMSYDPRYNQPSGAQVDANGFTTVIQLTADGRSVASVVYDGKFTDTYDHNDLGQITRVADHTGIVVVNEYDARTGFQLAIVTGDSRSTSEFGGGIAGRLGHPTRVIPPEGDAMTLIYNEALQVVERVRGTSRDLLAMDEQGRAVLQKSFIGEGKFRETSYEFNTKGFMTRSSVKDVEVDGGTSSLEYRFTPDSLSRVKTIVHPNGLQQTYEYNSRARSPRR